MKTILEKITDRIREEEKDKFDKFSLSEVKLKKRPDPIDILPLIKQNFFVIAETKKGSPSQGIIRKDYHPVFISAGYREAGASAISVLTEEHFFYGSKRHLPMVKENVDLPVLRKDFLVHPFQVYESYNLGADFVLLIAACLTDERLKELYDLTLSLGMQALIEVHTEEELKRVLPLNPKLIGINNRDLKTFHVDLGTSFRLKKMIPEDIFVISESGIRRSEDIKALKEAGFSGVLIGESLLKKADPSLALGKLLQGAFGDQGLFLKKPPLDPTKTFDNKSPRLKVCGLTNLDDYRDAVSLGADYVGFIFYSKSPRYVDKYKAAEIVRGSPKNNHKIIGVFVNEEIETIKDIYYHANLDIIQLHGDETPEYVKQLNLPSWKVIRVKDRQSLESLKHYDCKTFLLDTYSKDKYGGTGKSFPLELAEEALKWAADNGKNIIIAGGMSHENIETLLESKYPPYAIDVNSSIEDRPGKKNPDKMKLFFASFRVFRG